VGYREKTPELGPCLTSSSRSHTRCPSGHLQLALQGNSHGHGGVALKVHHHGGAREGGHPVVGPEAELGVARRAGLARPRTAPGGAEAASRWCLCVFTGHAGTYESSSYSSSCDSDCVTPPGKGSAFPGASRSTPPAERLPRGPEAQGERRPRGAGPRSLWGPGAALLRPPGNGAGSSTKEAALRPSL